MLLGLGTSLEIIEVNALGYAGDTPTGEYAMGGAPDLRPDDELLDAILIDMYGRFQLFQDLSSRSEPFSYIVTVTVDSVGDPIYYRFLFAEELGRAGSAAYRSRNYGYRFVDNVDFIEQYGITGLVYDPDGSLVIIEDGAPSSYRVWYSGYAGQRDVVYGDYSFYPWEGLPGTYMLYTNAPGYDSSYILPAFSLGEFPEVDDGNGGLLSSLIGFFTDIWAWLTGFFTNLTDWFLSILDILWDWLLSFIEFVLGLFIPTDVDSWMDLIYDIRDSLLSTTGTIGFILNYMIGILYSIATAPEISVLTVPGDFFGSPIVLNFNSIAENAPAAWSTMVLLIRGIFILNIWPPVVDFYMSFLFRDYRSSVIMGRNFFENGEGG